MVEEKATVVSIDGDSVCVMTQRKSSCEVCAAKKGCGTGVLAKSIGNKQMYLTMENPGNLGVGDDIIIGIQDEMLVKGSFAVYIVPILALLLSSWLGEFISLHLHVFSPEGMSIFFGLVGLSGGFLWLRRFSDKIRNDKAYQPLVLRHLDQ